VRLRGLSRIRRFWRRLRRTILPQRGAIILCYHRITDLPNSPRRLWVSPPRFAEQLEVITRYFTPISLSELVARLRNGNAPDKAIVVTFDDGYADNLWNAKPLLERYGVPATVFVTTGFVGTGREFYWDELERLLLLDCKVNEVYLDINGQKRHRQLATPEERLKAYHEIHDSLTPLSPGKRERVIEQLRQQLGVEEKGRDERRVMTVDELLEISRDGLVEIGAHTVNHPDLPSLPPELQWQEIMTSKRQLEGWLNRPVRWFAYPYGRGNATIRKLVRDAGFEAACAVIHRTVNENDDLFWLPRFFVENWDGEVFMKWLSEL